MRKEGLESFRFITMDFKEFKEQMHGGAFLTTYLRRLFYNYRYSDVQKAFDSNNTNMITERTSPNESK